MKVLNILTTCFALAAVVFFGSCEKEVLTSRSASSSNNEARVVESDDIVKEEITIDQKCDTVEKIFYAGQHINVGSIKVINDKDSLYITFSTINNWVMGQTHLYVGPKEDMPTTPKGNPKIGNFPYKTAHSPMVTSFTYAIALSEFDQDCYVIAAHAEVHHIGDDGEIDQSETAWGDGDPMTDKGSWAMYFEYCTCKITDV